MLKKNKKKIISAIWFLVKLNLLAVPLYLMVYFNVTYLPMQSFTASITQGLLDIAGYEFARNGNLLNGLVGNSPLRIEISWDSTGWKSLYALAAITIATPGIAYLPKLRFLLFALPAIFAINLARIFTTLIVSFNVGMQHFPLIHDFLWSGGMIGAVLGIWLFWLRKKRIIFGKTKFF